MRKVIVTIICIVLLLLSACGSKTPVSETTAATETTSYAICSRCASSVPEEYVFRNYLGSADSAARMAANKAVSEYIQSEISSGRESDQKTFDKIYNEAYEAELKFALCPACVYKDYRSLLNKAEPEE